MRVELTSEEVHWVVAVLVAHVSSLASNDAVRSILLGVLVKLGHDSDGH